MIPRTSLALLLLVWLLTACQPQAAPTATQWPATAAALPTQSASPTPTPTPTQVESATPTRLATATPPADTWAAPPTPRTHYELKAVLDTSQHILRVDEHIGYTNTTGSPLEELPLVVETLRYARVFTLQSLTGADGEKLPYRLKDLTITVHLPAPLPPDQAITLHLEYALLLPDVTRLPQVRPHPVGYTVQQTNLGDWYPFVPPFRKSAGWINPAAGFYGEHLAYDLADFEVALQMDGAQNLVVAAAAPGEARDGWLHFSHPAARNFAWSASPYYQVLTQTVALPGGGSTLAASYFYASQAAAGKTLLDSLTMALPRYSQLFGDYPRPMFSGVQADFLDGMEYDGLFFLSTDFYNWHKAVPEDFLFTLAAHETAHQWFGMLVANDQALEPWLDESLCTYSEVLFLEPEYPQALDWWWQYRVNYYEPQGAVNISIYDPPQWAGQYRLYRDPVYLRGAQMIQELRQAMGDEAFFSGLRAYVGRYAYGMAGGEGFWEVMQNFGGEAVLGVRDKYFSGGELPAP